jgi:D-alanyl-D-alanine carboxypeptidase
VLSVALSLTACSPDPPPPPSVTGISLGSSHITLGQHADHQVSATASYSDGTTRDVTATSSGVKYDSDNPEVAWVDDDGAIHVAYDATTGETAVIFATYAGFRAELNVTVKNLLSETVRPGEGSLPMVTNYYGVDALVNKQRNLPATYVPPDLVAPAVRFSFSGQAEKRNLRAEAALALEELFAAAGKRGLTLAAVSGYRSYATQEQIFNRNVDLYGRDEASRFSAYPGQSEHQTGLAMDVSCAAIGYKLEEEFARTPEGKWLAENAASFGFIIRYPEGSEDLTGYVYEPWHIRYVGKAVALDIAAQGVTMEEYFTR